MKTNTALLTDSNEEITLGWNAMPAYGEVMSSLIGSSHTNVTSTLNLEKKSFVKSFWSTLSGIK